MTASGVVESANSALAKSAPVTIPVAMIAAIFLVGVEWRDRQARADASRHEAPPQAVIPPEQMAVLMDVSKSVGSLDQATGQISKDVETIRKTQDAQALRVNEIADAVRKVQLELAEERGKLTARSEATSERLEEMLAESEEKMNEALRAHALDVQARFAEFERQRREGGRP